MKCLYCIECAHTSYIDQSCRLEQCLQCLSFGRLPRFERPCIAAVIMYVCFLALPQRSVGHSGPTDPAVAQPPLAYLSTRAASGLTDSCCCPPARRTCSECGTPPTLLGWGRPGPTGRIAYTAGTFGVGDRAIACKHVLMLAGGTGVTPMAQARLLHASLTTSCMVAFAHGCVVACGILVLHAAL